MASRTRHDINWFSHKIVDLRKKIEARVRVRVEVE